MSILDKVYEAQKRKNERFHREDEERFYSRVEREMGLVVCEDPPDNDGEFGTWGMYREMQPWVEWSEKCIKFGKHFFCTSNTPIEKLYDKIDELENKLKEKDEDIADLKDDIKWWKQQYHEALTDYKPKSKSKKSSKTTKNKKNETKPEDIDLSEIPF